MYFNHRLFFRAMHLALVKSPFRLRRWLYVGLFMILFWIMWLIVAIGRALDHLFYPGFKKQAVREPLFIVAPPRSGTTFTQKLLSLDSERFVHATLLQTIFPSVCYQRLFDRFMRLDHAMGGPLRKVVDWIEQKCFGGWDDKHKMRFNQPEEDDGFFVYTFITEAVFLLFPFVDELWEAGFADALPPEERRKLMRYYRSCLQRQLYANGPTKTILSKATQSSGALECLLEAFPDAKFLTIIRHPYQSVASHVSVFYPVWRTHSPEIAKDSDVSRAYGRLAVEWFRHLYQMRSRFPAQNYYCIDYRELTRDPVDTIEQVYRHYGFEVSAVFLERLVQATTRNGTYRSAHHYTLEEFGLSKEWICRELGDVLATYGLEA